jgi:hypothetical protein
VKKRFAKAAIAVTALATLANTVATLAAPDSVPGGSWWTGELVMLAVLGGAVGCVALLEWAFD